MYDCVDRGNNQTPYLIRNNNELNIKTYNLNDLVNFITQIIMISNSKNN